MSIPARLLTLAAGYIAALVIAFAAIYALRVIVPPTNDMRDFADAFRFVFLVGLFSLVPTGLAFYWLRHVTWLWYGAVAIAFAFVIIGALTEYAMRQLAPGPLGGYITLGTLIVLGSPLLVLAFLLAGLIAVSHRVRIGLFAAAALETLICANYYVRLVIGRAVF